MTIKKIVIKDLAHNEAHLTITDGKLSKAEKLLFPMLKKKKWTAILIVRNTTGMLDLINTVSLRLVHLSKKDMYVYYNDDVVILNCCERLSKNEKKHMIEMLKLAVPE